MGGCPPCPGAKAADMVLPRLRQLCGERVCHPGAACRHAHGVERQAAAKAHKEGKQPIVQQMKTAQKQAEEHRGQTAPKKSAPHRDER